MPAPLKVRGSPNILENNGQLRRPIEEIANATFTRRSWLHARSCACILSDVAHVDIGFLSLDRALGFLHVSSDRLFSTENKNAVLGLTLYTTDMDADLSFARDDAPAPKHRPRMRGLWRTTTIIPYILTTPCFRKSSQRLHACHMCTQYVRAATLSDRQCIDHRWPRGLGFPKGPCLTGWVRHSGTMHVCEAACGYVVFSLFVSNERVAFTREFGP
jgi:hypothetical protein